MTDRTTPQEASRAAFEAAMAPSLLPAGKDHPFYDRRSNGHYNNEWMQARWIGWQAATQARDAEVAALRDALKDAQWAINSMKTEAETAGAGGDEQMLQEACEAISNESLDADMAIRAILDPQQ